MNTDKAILVGLFIIFTTLPFAIAPEANPYTDYDIDSYNCLHIALDCQEWHKFNGIPTTVYIGLFNETDGHAWLVSGEAGEDIIGYVPTFRYKEVLTYEEFNRRYYK